MRYRSLAVLGAALLLGACDSPLDVDPLTTIPADQALTTARAVGAAVNGAYDSFQATALYSRDLPVYPELYADNMEVIWGTYDTDRQVDNRNIAPSNVALLDAWAAMYAGINQANDILAAIPRVGDLTTAQANRFRGEALFVRALHYLNLVRYFGGVPIVTEPTQRLNDVPQAAVPRSPVEEVYALIEQDLQTAATLLPGGLVPGRATRGAAYALLARAYLEQHKDAQARDLATAVIESGAYRLMDTYADLFQIQNSPESIFELQYTVIDSNSQAFWHFPYSLGGRIGYSPSEELYYAYEPGDERLDASIGFDEDDGLYGRKFFRIAKGDDNVIVIRLAEMYLIRAEANARLGAPAAVVRADIDRIRNRAGLDDLPASLASEAALIGALLQERRVEFAMEGHRFFDLRRNGRATDVLRIEPFRLLFPIPQSEREVNRALEQNPGY